MDEIDSITTSSGKWVLFHDPRDKVINVVLVRNGALIFLVEAPEFYDCPVSFLNSLSKQVLNEPNVIFWLIKRWRGIYEQAV